MEKTLSSWPNCGEFPRQRPREESRDTILKPSEEIGTTVLLTTHNLKEAEILCDRILLFNKSKIAEGTPKEPIEKVQALKTERKTIAKIKGKINLKDFDGIAKKIEIQSDGEFTYPQLYLKNEDVLSLISQRNVVDVQNSQVTLGEVFTYLF